MTRDIDIAHLKSWIGHEDSATETVTPQLVARFDATLEGLFGDAKARAHVSEPIAQLAKRVARLRDDLGVIATERESHVTWVETRGRSTSLGASPVEVGEVLRERLFIAGTGRGIVRGEDRLGRRVRVGGRRLC